MCLSSLVGVKGSCSDTNSYAFFIDDTPGINLKNAANISDTTGIDLLNKSIQNGASQVKQDIQHELIGKFRLNEQIKPFTYSRFSTGYTSVVKSGFKFQQLCDDCRLASLFITSVEFQTKEDFSGKVVVKQGNEVFEVTVISNAEIKSYVTINKKIVSTDFEIYLEEENGNTFDLLNTLATPYSSTCTITTIGNGLIKLNGFWQCDIDRVFCELKELFGRAVWYSSGSYFFEELSMTDRINYYSIYKSQEDAVEQKHILQGRYQKEIKLVATKLFPLLKKMGGCCIDCTGSGWTYQLP